MMLLGRVLANKVGMARPIVHVISVSGARDLSRSDRLAGYQTMKIDRSSAFSAS